MSKDSGDVKFGDYYAENIYTWCNNCGNYGVLAAVKRALVAENIHPHETVMIFDVGCNGNGADKITSYNFHSLHGRTISVGIGAALANRKMTVIASGGDGGTMGEGVNHLIHAIRSNYNLTFLLHNNMNFGLTQGQASPTTQWDIPMSCSPDGVTSDPMNIMSLVLSLNPSFAARMFSGNVKHSTEIIRKALNHKGFSLVEIFQSCPTYNKSTPHEWYQERVVDVAKIKGYDNTNIKEAKKISEDIENKLAIGVLYQDKKRKNFSERLKNRAGIESELVDEVKQYDVTKLEKHFR